MSPALLTAATILVPAVGAAIGLAFGDRRRLAFTVGIVAGLVTFGAAVMLLLTGPMTPVGEPATAYHPLPPLPMGELDLPLALLGNAPVAILAVAAAFVALIVQAYAVWYLRDDDRYSSFAATVSLFAAAMQLTVHAGDLVLLLVGWEVMGWCSYLLIGHWSRRADARRAAYKAFIVTRVADIAFVLGIVLLASGPASSELSTVIAYWTGAGAGRPLRDLAVILLIVGVLGKSAQFPFQDWLPDAMSGPAPASALIHAATMVAAGTFVLAQFAPLLVTSGSGRTVLAMAISVTMVVAALLALFQSDLKAMLAWSTVSQIGIMLAPLSVDSATDGAVAAELHLLAHALFKSLLFLALGWAALIAGGTIADALRGSGRRRVALTVALAVGFGSLAGVPPLLGSWTKEHLLAVVTDAAIAGSDLAWVVAGAVTATIVLTAAYTTRAMLILLLGSPLHPVAQEFHRERLAQLRSQAPDWWVGLLTAATIVPIGFIVGITKALGGTLHAGDQTFILSLILILLGATAGAVSVPLTLRVADAGLGFDQLYRALIATPVLALARAVAWIDERVVGGAVRGVGSVPPRLGAPVQGWQGRGRPASGILGVATGLVALVAAGVALWP